MEPSVALHFLPGSERHLSHHHYWGWGWQLTCQARRNTLESRKKISQTLTAPLINGADHAGFRGAKKRKKQGELHKHAFCPKLRAGRYPVANKRIQGDYRQLPAPPESQWPKHKRGTGPACQNCRWIREQGAPSLGLFLEHDASHNHR